LKYLTIKKAHIGNSQFIAKVKVNINHQNNSEFWPKRKRSWKSITYDPSKEKIKV